MDEGLRELAGRFRGGLGTLARLVLRARLQRSPHAVVAVGVEEEHLVDECFSSLAGSLSEDDLTHIDDVLDRIRLGLQELAGPRVVRERVGGIG